MLFVSRAMIDQHLPSGLYLGEFNKPLIARAVASLDRVGVPLTAEQSFDCVFSLVGQLLHAVRGRHMSEQLEAAGGPPFDLERFLDHFVRFSAAGIRVCAVDETTSPEAFGDGEN